MTDQQKPLPNQQLSVHCRYEAAFDGRVGGLVGSIIIDTGKGRIVLKPDTLAALTAIWGEVTPALERFEVVRAELEAKRRLDEAQKKIKDAVALLKSLGVDEQEYRKRLQEVPTVGQAQVK